MKNKAFYTYRWDFGWKILFILNQLSVSQSIFQGFLNLNLLKLANIAPYANIKYFNQTISDIFSKIKSEFILAGDMNINLLNYTNHIDTGLYLDTLFCRWRQAEISEGGTMTSY